MWSHSYRNQLKFPIYDLRAQCKQFKRNCRKINNQTAVHNVNGFSDKIDTPSCGPTRVSEGGPGLNYKPFLDDYASLFQISSTLVKYFTKTVQIDYEKINGAKVFN